MSASETPPLSQSVPAMPALCLSALGVLFHEGADLRQARGLRRIHGPLRGRARPPLLDLPELLLGRRLLLLADAERARQPAPGLADLVAILLDRDRIRAEEPHELAVRRDPHARLVEALARRRLQVLLRRAIRD